MPGVFRSSINLTRWRGAVPNPLNGGRVESFFGAGAIADVQAGIAREATLAATQGTVNTINANANNNAATYLAPTLNLANSYLPPIWNQITGAGVVVAPSSYVISKSIQRGDVAINNENQTGNSVIGAVTMAKARIGWGGFMSSQGGGPAYQMWLSAPTLVSAFRAETVGGVAGRYEVEEKP